MTEEEQQAAAATALSFEPDERFGDAFAMAFLKQPKRWRAVLAEMREAGVTGTVPEDPRVLREYYRSSFKDSTHYLSYLTVGVVSCVGLLVSWGGMGCAPYEPHAHGLRLNHAHPHPHERTNKQTQSDHYRQWKAEQCRAVLPPNYHGACTRQALD